MAKYSALLQLRRVGMESGPLIQAILDAAPEYYRNVDGVERDPKGAQDTLMSCPPGSPLEAKHVLVVSLVAISGAETPIPIGVVDLVRDYPASGTGFIGLFLVREDRQRKGWGKLAYAAVERYAREQLGCRRLRLAVVDAHPVAPFWVKQGFALTGEAKTHEGLRRHSIKRLMEKAI